MLKKWLDRKWNSQIVWKRSCFPEGAADPRSRTVKARLFVGWNVEISSTYRKQHWTIEKLKLNNARKLSAFVSSIPMTCGSRTR